MRIPLSGGWVNQRTLALRPNARTTHGVKVEYNGPGGWGTPFRTLPDGKTRVRFWVWTIWGDFAPWPELREISLGPFSVWWVWR